jgi:DNA-binding IclR family transcriptional regulator
VSDGRAPRSVISKVVAIQRSLQMSGPLTATELAMATELPLSTAHRIITELVDWQVLSREADGRYRLAPTPGTRGDVLRPERLCAAAAPIITDLRAVTRSTVRFGFLRGARVSYVEKACAAQPLSAWSPAATLPAHATAIGQVLLAFSAPAVVRRVIGNGLTRYTLATVTTADRLEHDLRAIRQQRIAMVSGQLRRDETTVAAPVFGPDPQVVAALEVRVHDIAEVRAVIPVLAIAARSLSRDLGHGSADRAATVVPLADRRCRAHTDRRAGPRVGTGAP